MAHSLIGSPSPTGKFLFLLGQEHRTAYSGWIGGDSNHSLVLETRDTTGGKDYIVGQLPEDAQVI